MTMILDGSNGLTMPTWTTANRPTSPIIGAQGYNTTYGGVEVCNGSAWDLITGGPAFSAYLPSNQTISATTWTKIQLSVKEFDTNNCFDATTNYRFTPTVPGYYQININISIPSASSRNVYSIYKNGSEFKTVSDVGISTNYWRANGGAIIYLNGTTDYVEMYAYSSATAVVGASSSTFMTGSFVRGQ